MATPTIDYAFYVGTYMGDSIPETEFPRLAMRATATLDRFKRIYTVLESNDAEKLALCSMADALYYFEAVTNTTISGSSSVGSVSSSASSQNPVDIQKSQSAELLRCAEMYLEIFRGCGNA